MNVKQGDLAIITDTEPMFGGKVVKVLAPYGLCSQSIDTSFHWWVQAPEVFDIGRGELKDKFLFPDSRMRPVSGLPDTEDTDIEQPIKVTA